jgi:hypothetical protein
MQHNSVTLSCESINYIGWLLYRFIEVVDALVRNKADLNLEDKDGQTAYSLGKKIEEKKI